MPKENIISITEQGGNRLNFRITQMKASRQADFIVRALLLLAPGLDAEQAKEAVFGGGSEGLIAALLKVEYEKAKPMLDELLGYCKRMVDGQVEQACTPDLLDGFVTDFMTIFKLYREVLSLNFGFFTPATAPEAAAKSSDSPAILNMPKPRAARAM
jgi:hypothetical protein